MKLEKLNLVWRDGVTKEQVAEHMKKIEGFFVREYRMQEDNLLTTIWISRNPKWETNDLLREMVEFSDHYLGREVLLVGGDIDEGKFYKAYYPYLKDFVEEKRKLVFSSVEHFVEKMNSYEFKRQNNIREDLLDILVDGGYIETETFYIYKDTDGDIIGDENDPDSAVEITLENMSTEEIEDLFDVKIEG